MYSIKDGCTVASGKKQCESHKPAFQEATTLYVYRRLCENTLLLYFTNKFMLVNMHLLKLQNHAISAMSIFYTMISSNLFV